MPVIEQDYVGFGIDPKTGKRHTINHLPKVAEWQDEIYQYEQKDKLIGGEDGIDNLQAQELANRTEYLKAQTDAHAEKIKKIEDEGAGGAGVFVCDIAIPATGWKSGTGDYPYRIDIANEKITADTIPVLTVLPVSVQEAAACGICPACETAAGALRVYAMAVPDAALSASLTLISPKGGGGDAELPIATESALGAVKIGQGLTVQSDGTVSVDKTKVITDEDIEDVSQEEIAEDLKKG